MSSKSNTFRPSKSESKAEATTKIAKGIIDAENNEREAKTQRLRAARLEREASEKTSQAAPPKKTPSGK